VGHEPEVKDLVERFQRLLANRRPGPGPVTELRPPRLGARLPLGA